jgi:argininosuccinate lyase
MAFRDAHEAVGKAVRLAEARQLELPDLSLEQLRDICEHIDSDVFDVLTLEGSVESRNHMGGTAPRQVREAIAAARQALVVR